MSNTNFKKLGVLIGVRDLVFCKVTSDDAEGIAYDGDIMSAPGVIEVALSAQVTNDQLGADDNPFYEIMNSKDGYEVSIIQAALGSDMTSYLLGTQVDDNGVEIENADDEPPYVAAGFKTARSDGSDDYVWLYKGKFAQGDQTFHTKEQGTVNWQTPTLTGTFGPRIYDKAIKAVVNSKDSAAASILETFFSAVYEKTVTASSSSSNSGTTP